MPTSHRDVIIVPMEYCGCKFATMHRGHAREVKVNNVFLFGKRALAMHAKSKAAWCECQPHLNYTIDSSFTCKRVYVEGGFILLGAIGDDSSHSDRADLGFYHRESQMSLLVLQRNTLPRVHQTRLRQAKQESTSLYAWHRRRWKSCLLSRLSAIVPLRGRSGVGARNVRRAIQDISYQGHGGDQKAKAMDV